MAGKKRPGAYVPLHTDYLRDPDIRRAGPEAELLYIRGLAYSKGEYTDGLIPDFDLSVIAVDLRNVAARVAALVEHDLWIVVDGGWQIRSWSRWNEASEITAARKQRAAERQAAKRERDRRRDDSQLRAVSHR